MSASPAIAWSAARGRAAPPSCQIATPAGTTFGDTGLTASTSYSYRVKAVDAATNVSVNYSTVASATTPAPPDTMPPSDVDRPHRHRRQQQSDHPQLDRRHRQRGRHRLSRRALSGGGLHHLCPDRHPDARTATAIRASRPAPATATA